MEGGKYNNYYKRNEENLKVIYNTHFSDEKYTNKKELIF